MHVDGAPFAHRFCEVRLPRGRVLGRHKCIVEAAREQARAYQQRPRPGEARVAQPARTQAALYYTSVTKLLLKRDECILVEPEVITLLVNLGIVICHLEGAHEQAAHTSSGRALAKRASLSLRAHTATE